MVTIQLKTKKVLDKGFRKFFYFNNGDTPAIIGIPISLKKFAKGLS